MRLTFQRVALPRRDILNFLREGELPQHERVRAVHREAQYYSIAPLLERLEDTQPLTGEKVRQAFLDLLPYYKGKHGRPVGHDYFCLRLTPPNNPKQLS